MDYVTPLGKRKRQTFISGAEVICAFKESALKTEGVSDFET